MSPGLDESSLFPRGNAPRWLRGGLTATVSGALAFLLMADDRQLPFGVPLGIALLAVATFGVLDLTGSFDDATGDVASTTTLSTLARPLAGLVAGLVVFSSTLAGAAAGLLRPWVWGPLVTAAFVGLVLAVFRVGVALGPWALDEDGRERPVWERQGFWVIVAGSVLLLPCMGSYSLWDPWETHYGEVAREILARDDWISLWWVQDGWFWSKPILDFWLQAIFMATLGVHYQPGRMLEGAFGAEAHPEWVVRAPIFLVTVLAMYVLYKGVARVFGRRGGLLGALVLATMPHWWLLAHQTMTDMPFVAPTTCAMGLMLYGLYSPEDARARLYEVKAGGSTWRLSSWHLVFGAVVLCALPQILYLVSRNVELVTGGPRPLGLHLRWDELRSGSGMGNCGLPGNEACTPSFPAAVPVDLRQVSGLVPSLRRFVSGLEPTLQAGLWTSVLGFVLYLNWGERRVRRLAYLGAWFFAAIATMGKGPAGFALPILCGLAYVATTRRWGELARFELVSGLCIVLAVALPWGVAMWVRHGPAFTQRLIVHDMVDRAFSHVHDTNEGDDTSFRFYIWQLGYALFPWTGLVPLGLVYSLRRSDTADDSRGQASIFLLMWFVFAFALFSFMGTKFHHYILPAVPPAAMLLGVTLDDLLGRGPVLARLEAGARAGRAVAAQVALFAASLALAVYGVSRAWPGFVDGERPTPGHGDASYLAAGVLTLGGAGLFAVCIARFRAASDAGEARGEPTFATADGRRSASEDLGVAAAAVGGALLVLVVGRDLIVKPDGADPGAIRFVHLITYNYRRPWPEALDYSAILTGFTLVACALGLALAARRIRKQVIVALLAFSFVWAAWGLDVYMVRTAPHWGQHELLAAYYAQRAGPEEPFVAYQMNWKGENFYTGNRMATFVSGGGAFATWLKKQREQGVKVVYVVTEHGRVAGLKAEIKPRALRELTDKTQNNKFVLVRAEL